MLPEHLQEARDLLLLRRDDLGAAERLLQGPPLLSLVRFHSQQAAEKALKSYLTVHQTPYPRTHDLGELIDLSAIIDRDFTVLEPASDSAMVGANLSAIIDRDVTVLERIADSLTPYAVEARYERAYAGVSTEFAQEVLENAREIVSFVESRLPPEVVR